MTFKTFIRVFPLVVWILITVLIFTCESKAAVEPTPVRVVSGPVTSQMINQLTTINNSIVSNGVTLEKINTSIVSNTASTSEAIRIGASEAVYAINTQGNSTYGAIVSNTQTTSAGTASLLASLSTINTNITSASNLNRFDLFSLQGSVSAASTVSHQDFLNLSTSNTAIATSAATSIIAEVSTNTTQTVSGNNTIISWLSSIWTRLGDKSQITKITGGDGLYTATVDSLNRLSVNANIQFPEAVYSSVNLLNGSSKAMNVNGTTPVIFQYTPASGTTYYVEGLSFYLADDAAFLSDGFGALAALTNGVVIEYQSKGVLYTFTNMQSNGDILNALGENSFGALSTALLATDAYIAGSSKVQQRIALDPAFGDFLRARVRDNLTGLTTFNIRVRVWRVN